MEVAREGRLQLSDCGNQERYPQDGNSAAGLTQVNVPESSTRYMLNTECSKTEMLQAGLQTQL